MPRKCFQPKELFASQPWGFSQVVVAEKSKIVHISGQVAWNSEGKCLAQTLEGQFKQVMQNIFHALHSVNASAENIQMLRLYIPNFQPGKDADLISSLLIETFGTENQPASTWLGVQALAQPEYLIEIDCVAAIN